MAIEKNNLSALPNHENSRRKTVESIRRIKGWENVSDEEAVFIQEQFESLATILIEGLPPERLDKVIEKIKKQNGNTR